MVRRVQSSLHAALSAVTTGLGVRIYRDDRPIGFWEPGAKSLQSGDLIIEIAEGDGQDRP